MIGNAQSFAGPGIFGRHRLKSIVVMIAGSIGIATYLLYLYDRETWETARSGVDRYLQHLPHTFDKGLFGMKGESTGAIQKDHAGRFCTSVDYANGQWVLRSNPPTSLDDIRKVYSTTDRARIECNPPELPISSKGLVPIDDPAHLARMLNNTRWKWQPSSDCLRHELSLEAFVVRMLRSKAGIIFIGDSLSEQHHMIIRNFLISSNGPFLARSYGSRPRIDMFYLKPDDDRSKHYLELSGVTEDRLQNPISTFILDRHLLSPNEYDKVFESLDGYIPLSTQDAPHQWVANSIWDAEIHKLLDKTMALRRSDSVADFTEEPTILVLSTGPHWLSREITSEKGVSDEDLLTSYEHMANRVVENLTAIHHVADIKIWYRASTPGHVDCQDIQEPVSVNPIWTPHPGKPAWNWHMMEPFNDIWTSRIDKARSTGLRIAYLDVYPMSLQRGDSHLLPPNDCLHFCYQGVIEEWQQFLWQEIVRESANDDYDIGSPIYL